MAVLLQMQSGQIELLIGSQLFRSRQRLGSIRHLLYRRLRWLISNKHRTVCSPDSQLQVMRLILLIKRNDRLEGLYR
ncbi:hypothetical protein D3C81_1837030 [compost metagenome]